MVRIFLIVMRPGLRVGSSQTLRERREQIGKHSCQAGLFHDSLPNSFVFAQVPSTAAENAFEFHRYFASGPTYPRIETELEEFAQRDTVRCSSEEYERIRRPMLRAQDSCSHCAGRPDCHHPERGNQRALCALRQLTPLCTGFSLQRSKGFRRSWRTSAMTISLLEDC